MRGTTSGCESATLINAKAAHPGARCRSGRQQRRLRILLVEVFEDRQRLE